MKYLHSNDFYVFPWQSNVELSRCIIGCVTISGHVPRGRGAKSTDIPSRGTCYYCTAICCRVIPFFDSLRKECFSLPTLSYFVPSAELWVVVVLQFCFWVPSPLLGQKYVFILLKRLIGPLFIAIYFQQWFALILCWGPVYKFHVQHWFKFTCTVVGRKGKNKRIKNSCFLIISNNQMIFPFRESSFYFNILAYVVNARKHFTTLDAPSIS